MNTTDMNCKLSGLEFQNGFGLNLACNMARAFETVEMAMSLSLVIS